VNVIRTFVAVLLDEDLRKKIAEAQEQVKRLAPDVKWVAPENFHVTLKFLGNVREDRIGEIAAAIDETAQGFSPFEMTVSGLGAFPNPARARVIWTGIETGGEQLRDLAEAVDVSLARLGFERETRLFASHITIGRVKTSRFLGALADGIREVDASNLGAQRVTSVFLMESQLLREGPMYSPLNVSELTAASENR
jgi:2'-5' RNA ligase